MSYYQPVSKESLNLESFGVEGEPEYVKSDFNHLSKDGEIIYFVVNNINYIAFVDDYLNIEIVQSYLDSLKKINNSIYVILKSKSNQSSTDPYSSTERKYNNPLYVAREINENK